MAGHEKATHDKQADEKQKRRVKRQESEPVFDQSLTWDTGPFSVTETPFHPRMEEHAAKLSRIPFSAQRHEFIMRLNKTYGLSYVQRLLASVNAQAKLTVSQPGDIYEQEADRVAEEVTRSINTPVRKQDEEEELQMQAEDEEELLQGKLIRRQTPEEEEELIQGTFVKRQDEEEELQTQPDEGTLATVAGDIESRINSARGGGQPLSDEVRQPMEQAFGTDFSGVRTHTDTEADTLNRELSAKAFTTGQDVFFREGEYSPGSESGNKLIVHELTHVVQQTGRPKPQQYIRKQETTRTTTGTNFGSRLLRSVWGSSQHSEPINLFAKTSIQGKVDIPFSSHRDESEIRIQATQAEGTINTPGKQITTKISRDTASDIIQRITILGTVVPDPAPEGANEICHDFVYRWLVIRGNFTGNYPDPMNTLGQANAQNILFPAKGAAARAGGKMNVNAGQIIGFWDAGGNLQHTMIAQTATTWVGSNNVGSFGVALGRQTINNVHTYNAAGKAKFGWNGAGNNWKGANGAMSTVFCVNPPVKKFP